MFHAGDGNMHPLILFDANKPGDLELCEAFGAEILKLCVEVGGCLTGEHGVGIEKRDLMIEQYAPDDLEIQMAVKDVFDPGWLLNPAKVFPAGTSSAARRTAQHERGAAPATDPPEYLRQEEDMTPKARPSWPIVAGPKRPLRVQGGGTRALGPATASRCRRRA